MDSFSSIFFYLDGFLITDTDCDSVLLINSRVQLFLEKNIVPKIVLYDRPAFISQNASVNS